MSENMEQRRNSKLELIRIICIFLIVLRHYGTQANWGENTFTVANWSWQVLFIQLIEPLGSAANNVFLLISGYFMVNKKINWKRIITLVAEMFFYSWIIIAILYGTKCVPFSLKETIKAAIPIWFGYNWYVCCYAIFCCFLPFLNPIFSNAEKGIYKRFLIVALLLASVMKTFKGINYIGNHSSVDHFMIMYAIGGYIKRFGLKSKKYSWGMLSCISIVFILLSVIGLNVGGYILKKDIFINHAIYFGTDYTITAIATALFVFMWAITSKPIYKKSINTLAKSVIGIFIIHFNPLLKDILFNKIYPNADYLHSNLLPLHCIIKVSLIFLVCLIIDQIRLMTVDRFFQRFLDKHWESFGIKANKYAGKLKHLFYKYF